MISRRNFLKVVVGGLTVYPFKNVLASNNKSERILNMYNIHTGERLDIKYYDSGIYDPHAMNKINYLLRCHYTDEVKDIDMRVIDLLCDIKDIFGRDRKVEIISGYRSTLYNRYLRSLGRGVGRNSLHQSGLAIDFKILGISNDKLSRIARSFKAGGVGRYPEFIHIDTGPVRSW
jgi:uncharacterized protein YcbK (DUF882 family)